MTEAKWAQGGDGAGRETQTLHGHQRSSSNQTVQGLPRWTEGVYLYQVSSNCHACSQATTKAPMVIDLVCFDEKVETARNSPNFKSTLSLSRPQISVSFDQARGTQFNCFTTGSCKKNSFHDVSLSHNRVSVGKTSWHQRDLKGCLCISSYTFSSFDSSHYLCSLSRKFWLLTLLLCTLYGKSLTI